VRCLTFRAARSTRAVASRGKRIRSALFEERSSLPTSAACVVANGVRETLTSLIGAPIAMRLFEPAIPSPRAWGTIVCDAALYRVRGNVADAAVVLRASQACALAAAVFGEPAPEPARRELSPLENEVLERVVRAIAANLGVVCGARDALTVERVSGIASFVTYFELLVETPVVARIGIALSREPSAEPRGGLELAHLKSVRVAAPLVLDLGETSAGAFARLHPGSLVPIAPADMQRCTLALDGRGFARGSAGISNGRFALLVEAVGESR
jgi:flagellar motor switch protein FliM